MLPETGITLVSLQPSDRDVRIRLSTGEEMELAAESLPPALVVGEPVSDRQLQDLREAAQRKQIAKLVFRMLDRRLLTRRMALEKLLAKDYSREASMSVLDAFEAQGLLSDRLYALAWCRDTLRAKAVGRAYLKSGLLKKGVDAGLSDEVVRECLDPQTERDGAEAAARKWWARQPGTATPREIARGVRHLQARGFPAGLANEAIRQLQPKDGTTG